MDITSKQQLVLLAIQDNPEAANDDALLLSLIWEREGWDSTKPLSYNLHHVSRPETISRRRRELYNLGLIEYTDKAEKERTEAFKDELEQHSSHQAVSWLND